MFAQAIEKVSLFSLLEPPALIRRANIKFRNDWRQENWAHKRFIVNHQYRFIYCPIFKNASTSMLAAMLQLSPSRRKEALLKSPTITIRLYVDLNYSLASYSYRDAKKLIDSDYSKFVIVRNPWARIVSAYCNFFVRSLMKGRVSDFAKDVARSVHGDTSDPTLARSVTFEQLLQYICKTDNVNLNKHCLPQHLFLGDVDFDFIVRLENLDQDLKHLSEKLNIPLEMPEINQTKYQETTDTESVTKCYADVPAEALVDLPGGLPSYEKFYNSHLKELIRQRYAKSIQLFNYDFV